MRSPPCFLPFPLLAACVSAWGAALQAELIAARFSPSHPAARAPQRLEEQSVSLRATLLGLASSTYGRGKRVGCLSALRSESPTANCSWQAAAPCMAGAAKHEEKLRCGGNGIGAGPCCMHKERSPGDCSTGFWARCSKPGLKELSATAMGNRA